MDNEIFCTVNRSDAFRELKRLANVMDHRFSLYIAYNEYYEKYFVTDDQDELTDAIYKRWSNGGCDPSPEVEGQRYFILEYVVATKKELYPSSYRNAKRSLLKTEEPLIRREVSIECEYDVAFYVS